MHSIDHEANSLGGGIRGIILASHYLIEPTGAGKSKLTHISRIDSRGRQAKWYNKSYGIIAASNLLKVKESFTKALNVNVHETKVWIAQRKTQRKRVINNQLSHLVY